jgi:hypothetical protein
MTTVMSALKFVTSLPLASSCLSSGVCLQIQVISSPQTCGLSVVWSQGLGFHLRAPPQSYHQGDRGWDATWPIPQLSSIWGRGRLTLPEDVGDGTLVFLLGAHDWDCRTHSWYFKVPITVFLRTKSLFFINT